ncbi:hypothetical protein FDK12_02250 [Arthrobacter sp. NamB2]|uniref:hypothetical protein n=1 Tax=unclassified Arthrobacter TaxID=235627 RepID=UPI0011394B24|nr:MULTISPECIES: hypothetical protein [unclassified Arthrobacter]TKV29749.1 hypothetical protein FDK12_02250 [Arthrobacter sp. NamB2]
MDSPSRGRLDAGAPSPLAHPLPGADAPADVGSDQDAASLQSDAADPLRRGPLHTRPGVAEEGM